MKLVEFIGPSGIGKTTFFKHLLKEKNGTLWFTENEAIQNHVKKMSFKEVRGFANRIRFMFIMLNILNKNHFSYAIQILSLHREKAFDLWNEKYSEFTSAFLDCLISKNIPGHLQIKMINLYYQKLQQVMLLQYLNIEELIVMHDGIFHLNCGIGDWRPKYDELHYACGLPAAVVHFTGTKKDIVGRIKERNRKGRGTFLQNGLEDEELDKSVEESLEEDKKKIQLLKMVKVPMLHININENPKNSLLKMAEFLQSVKEFKCDI